MSTNIYFAWMVVLVSCTLVQCSSIVDHSKKCVPLSNCTGYGGRAAERIVGAQGNYKKWGHTIDCVRGVWGHTPPKIEILHALKCVLGASEAPFRACIQYMHICKLPSSFSGFRLKSAT